MHIVKLDRLVVQIGKLAHFVVQIGKVGRFVVQIGKSGRSVVQIGYLRKFVHFGKRGRGSQNGAVKTPEMIIPDNLESLKKVFRNLSKISCRNRFTKLEVQAGRETSKF